MDNAPNNYAEECNIEGGTCCEEEVVATEPLTEEEMLRELEVTRNKCNLLEGNLQSAYEKIRMLEATLNNKIVKERATDALITQTMSVCSNTVMLAIKNKEQ